MNFPTVEDYLTVDLPNVNIFQTVDNLKNCRQSFPTVGAYTIKNFYQSMDKCLFESFFLVDYYLQYKKLYLKMVKNVSCQYSTECVFNPRHVFHQIKNS